MYSCKKVFISLFLLIVSALISLNVNNEKINAFSIGRSVPIYCVDTKEKKVAITFDSTWGVNNTMKILDILDKYHVKATFFIVGNWADDFPDEVKEIYKRGHEIGNHSNKHPDMSVMSREGIVKEIAAADAKIFALTGRKTELFRCPEGTYNNLLLKTVDETNHYCIQWSVDSIDWKEEDPYKEYERVVTKVKPGSIILFHNGAKYTTQTLPKVIQTLTSKGYKFVKVSDLIYKDNYKIDSTGKQIHYSY